MFKGIYYFMMTVVLGLAATQTQAAVVQPKILIDFSSLASSGFWRPVTDQVRGGQSTAFMQINADQTATISGELKLNDTGAGFSSYRVQPGDGEVWDLSQQSELVLNSKGDGRVYKVVMDDANSAQSPRNYTWEAQLPASADTFSEIKIPLKSFVPISRGRPITGVPPLEADKIAEIGIQLNDKIPGPFQIDLKSIEAL